MDIHLTSNEIRVIACLLEKQHTTPDQYPLSLSALTSACNQKSSRDPVLDLDEATVQDTVDTLIRRHYVTDRSGFGSRVTRYQHRFCNTEFGTLKFSAQETGIICVLMLRGPQTPGELRTRTERLCRFRDVAEVEATLDQLMRRDDGPFVVRLPREPGKRESRFTHLFAGAADRQEMTVAEADVTAVTPVPGSLRMDQFEQQLQQLQDAVADLKAQLDRIAAGHEGRSAR